MCCSWATRYNVEVNPALGGVLEQVTCRGYFQPSKARPASLSGSKSLIFMLLPLQVQQRGPCRVLRSSKNCWHSQPLEHETSASTGPKQVCPCAWRKTHSWELLAPSRQTLVCCFFFFSFLFLPDAENKQGGTFQSLSASALLKQQKQKLLEARKKRSEEIQRR